MEQSKETKIIIACASIKPELEKILKEKEKTFIELSYIDQNLHRHPERIKDAVVMVIEEQKSHFDKIILGYGLCSNGIVGITAPKQGIIVPRVHDCIALYMGSSKKYLEQFDKSPGTYYLTPGWLENGKDPLTTMKKEYGSRLSKEDAEECMKNELSHYKQIIYLNTFSRKNSKELVKKGKENARFFKKEYFQMNGSLSYFEKILYGPYNWPEFVIFKEGEKIKQSIFLKP